jgi:hypothetical protein
MHDTFAFRLQVPFLESAVSARNRGWTLRDNLFFGTPLDQVGGAVGYFVSLGYEFLFGYRQQGFGLLGGMQLDWGVFGRDTRLLRRAGGDTRFTYPLQVMAEVPCPWTRIPFQILAFTNPRPHGMFGVSGSIPLGLGMALFVAHTRSALEVVETPGTWINVSRTEFGFRIDMFDYFHVFAP